jgi:hypothetical protein
LKNKNKGKKMYENSDEIDDLKDAKELTPEKNIKIMKDLVKNWNLGPIKASELRTANKHFWSNIAKVWYLTEKEARRRNCGNCEYGRTAPVWLESMEHIPNNAFDNNGGGRVWCTKFDFICHNLRVCMAYEEK